MSWEVRREDAVEGGFEGTELSGSCCACCWCCRPGEDTEFRSGAIAIVSSR
jgi:hypothetical protein